MSRGSPTARHLIWDQGDASSSLALSTKCLLCSHPSVAHVRIPPEDPESQREAEHFLRLARGAHARHVEKTKNDPGRQHNFSETFSFENRPCTRGIVERDTASYDVTNAICPCQDMFDTKKKLEAWKAKEARAYVPDSKRARSPESQARSALSSELARMESLAREKGSR